MYKSSSVTGNRFMRGEIKILRYSRMEYSTGISYYSIILDSVFNTIPAIFATQISGRVPGAYLDFCFHYLCGIIEFAIIYYTHEDIKRV